MQHDGIFLAYLTRLSQSLLSFFLVCRGQRPRRADFHVERLEPVDQNADDNDQGDYSCLTARGASLTLAIFLVKVTTAVGLADYRDSVPSIRIPGILENRELWALFRINPCVGSGAKGVTHADFSILSRRSDAGGLGDG
jgi:hypothetical protein